MVQEGGKLNKARDEGREKFQNCDLSLEQIFENRLQVGISKSDIKT